MSYLVRITPAAPGNALLHFPGDGEGNFTSLVGTAARTATYTSDAYNGSTATLTGGQSVPGSAGDRGYCFTSDGYYANYTVVTAGANGVVVVDLWRHGTLSQLGNLPTGTITFHATGTGKNNGCCLASYTRSMLESIEVRVAGAGDVLSITDAAGTVVDTYSIPAAAASALAEPLYWADGKVYKGIFGFQFTTGTILGVDLLFRGQKAATEANLIPSY